MFLSHIHSFRGLAIIGIVGAHSIHSFDWTSDDLTFMVLDTLCNQSSIWFFFIAGLLFQHLSPRYETRKYLKNKLVNVITPYLILSIPAIYVSVWMIPQDSVPPEFYDYPQWAQIGIFLYTGKHLAPFWFVPTIALFYLVAPLLLRIDRTPRLYLLLPLLMLLSAYLGRGGLQGILGMPLAAAPFSKAVYLFSVYVFGMFCGHYHQQVLDFTKRWEIPLWLLAGGFFTANILYFGEQSHFLYFFKIATCPLLMVLLLRNDAAVKDKLYYLGDVSLESFSFTVTFSLQ